MQRGRYINLAALVGALALAAGTSPATAQLPAGWTAADLGTTTPKTPDGTTVTGSGASAVWTVTCTNGTGDVWGATDPGFEFAYTTLTGDGGVTARLLSQVGGKDTDWSKNGTMLRADTTPGAPQAFLSYASATGGKDPQTFQPSWRANPNGKPLGAGSSNPTDSYGTDAVEPIPGTHRVEKGSIWMRTQRIGTTYQHLVSNDGTNWLLLGSETVNIDPSKPVLAGIWASQGGSKTPNVVTYDNVDISSDIVTPAASTQAPAPTLVQAIPGNGAVLLTFEPAEGAAGTNIYREVAGTTKMTLVNTMPTANGWIIDTGVTNGTTYLYTLKSVVDLTKVGGTMAESISGSSQALAEPQVPIAGLVSMDINTLNPGTTTLDTTGAKPTLTITGSGTDIWDATDGFRFAATAMTGDYSLTAAVLSKPTPGAGNTSAWVKAGVMIRETLDPGSRDTLVATSSGNGVEFQERADYRDNSATSLISQQGTKDAATTYPVWLKISRTGDSITGSQSTDGTTFTPIGKAFKQINLSANTFAGLAVTAHTSDQKKSTLYGTGVFDASSIKIGAP